MAHSVPRSVNGVDRLDVVPVHHCPLQTRWVAMHHCPLQTRLVDMLAYSYANLVATSSLLGPSTCTRVLGRLPLRTSQRRRVLAP